VGFPQPKGGDHISFLSFILFVFGLHLSLLFLKKTGSPLPCMPLPYAPLFLSFHVPSELRKKSSVEAASQSSASAKSCSLCKEKGHSKPKCPTAAKIGQRLTEKNWEDYVQLPVLLLRNRVLFTELFQCA